MEKEHKQEHKQKTKIKLKKSTIWQLVSVVLAVALVYSFSSGCKSGSIVSSDEAGEKTVDFITNALLQGAKQAELTGVEEESSMYKVSFAIEGETYPSYVSKDGKLLFLQYIDMDSALDEMSQGSEDPQTTDVPKSDKPKVELFVMSHCPYGTQIEKGMVPVANLLGDKIDFSVKFVYYAMHGKTELDEELLQHCIQKEEKGKYLDYLECFLADGDTETCVSEAGIDTASVDECVSETDEEFSVSAKYADQSTWLSGRYPLFDVDKELNTKYGVGGSPYLVINGASPSTGRDSASLLNAVCAAFSNAPEECGTQLSSASPSAGFGYTAGSSGSTGSCG
ncbi:hypothetical protein JW707_01210 [Candidatus Woesearchaeota archaeon]|nr:hypothetical protein [Candidatus Woesearchaeota archaeon]